MSFSRQRPLKYALIGFGAIGRRVVETLNGRPGRPAILEGILVRDLKRVASTELPAKVMVNIVDLLVARHPDIIVECAGQEAVSKYGPRILRAGIDLMVVSAGALTRRSTFEELMTAASDGGGRIVVPSGAIGGLDWLAAAKLAGLTDVVYRARKPARIWACSRAENAHLSDLREERMFYRGTVREAAAAYPKNVNVAAAVALATLGFDRTRVELIATPEEGDNCHEVEAVGDAGSMRIKIRGKPDPSNPNTSVITGHSVAQCLLKQSATIVL
ncbi:aspartate dehydrogenase [Bradyrhizobium sp. KB893862 SZCCT0404]|uniref:aspartate dehydrogenase n=1 Tax=Bradyrhizobium sp. KB893862 SZCCT0404 TaxID=2807672 RepID=UPI00201319A7|nr:aspartate dehydrogenase [Bradyrhizobium sp. KB893862 SZCCT0404]